MISPTELRIGNWIHIGGKNTTIGEIFDDGITTDLDKHFYEYMFGDLEPIPLTEEWLLKFGFEKFNNCYLNKGSVILHITLDMVVTLSSLLEVKLKSVYQLQNLYFALTGEELKIKSETISPLP